MHLDGKFARDHFGWIVIRADVEAPEKGFRLLKTLVTLLTVIHSQTLQKKFTKLKFELGKKLF